jgi:hypothetical protein
MNQDKAILILLVSSLWVATLGALIYACVRRYRVDAEWKWSQDYDAIKQFANDQIVVETLRLMKHSILCVLILMTPNDPPPLMEARNIGIASVGLLIGLTSAWSLYRRHYRFNRFRKAYI